MRLFNYSRKCVCVCVCVCVFFEQLTKERNDLQLSMKVLEKDTERALLDKANLEKEIENTPWWQMRIF